MLFKEGKKSEQKGRKRKESNLKFFGAIPERIQKVDPRCCVQIDSKGSICCIHDDNVCQRICVESCHHMGAFAWFLERKKKKKVIDSRLVLLQLDSKKERKSHNPAMERKVSDICNLQGSTDVVQCIGELAEDDGFFTRVGGDSLDQIVQFRAGGCSNLNVREFH